MRRLSRVTLIAAIALCAGAATEAATLRCTLLTEGGKCAEASLQGPIQAEPVPGQPALQWTQKNPLIPKTQADLDNVPPGSWVKSPVTGELLVRSGDYETTARFLRTNWPATIEIDLISDGGSAYEAMKIGRLLRKYLITTYVPATSPRCSGAGCVCASACALIWFGGVQRLGTVGLHRPRFDDPEFANLPPEEASILYRKVLKEIEKYLEEMEAPPQIIQAMVATSSSDMYWVNSQSDQLSRPPSYAEWEDASCHEKFDPKSDAIFFLDGCRTKLRSTHRELLSPP